jgi:hypothetical protein
VTINDLERLPLRGNQSRDSAVDPSCNGAIARTFPCLCVPRTETYHAPPPRHPAVAGLKYRPSRFPAPSRANVAVHRLGLEAHRMIRLRSSLQRLPGQCHSIRFRAGFDTSRPTAPAQTSSRRAPSAGVIPAHPWRGARGGPERCKSSRWRYEGVAPRDEARSSPLPRSDWACDAPPTLPAHFDPKPGLLIDANLQNRNIPACKMRANLASPRSRGPTAERANGARASHATIPPPRAGLGRRWTQETRLRQPEPRR